MNLQQIAERFVKAIEDHTAALREHAQALAGGGIGALEAAKKAVVDEAEKVEQTAQTAAEKTEAVVTEAVKKVEQAATDTAETAAVEVDAAFKTELRNNFLALVKLRKNAWVIQNILTPFGAKGLSSVPDDKLVEFSSKVSDALRTAQAATSDA